MNEQKIQYIKNNYEVFGLGSILYGILYVALLYKNTEAFTFPIFIAATLGICVFVLSKFNIKVKKEGYFLIAIIQLLGISVCLTENPVIITFNKTGIILLILFFMMEQVYNTKGWRVGTNIGKMFMRAVGVVACFGKPWSHLYTFSFGKEDKKHEKRKHILLGIVIAIPLVVIISALLANADQTFLRAFDMVFENIVSVDTILIILSIVIVYSLMYSFICSSVETEEEEITVEKKKAAPMVAITFTTIITLIYICFCILQISYLFNGYSDGVTYSQFAREGFFELLFVSGINLIMVVICIEVFEKSKALDMVLVIISACTYILIASSVYRMILYVDAYNLTFLRIYVFWFLLVLTVWITGAIVYIKKRSWNYFKFSVYVMAAMYLFFAYANPDRMIIRYNIKNAEEITTEDIDYFCSKLEPRVVVPEIPKMKEKFAPSEVREIEAKITRYCDKVVWKNNETAFRETNFAKKQAYKEAKILVGDIRDLARYEYSYNEEEGCGEIHYKGIIYRQFGFVGGEMRGMELGAVSEEHIIYELAGYDSKEWILSYEKEFMDSDWIYKAVGVEVPEELEEYRIHDYE